MWYNMFRYRTDKIFNLLQQKEQERGKFLANRWCWKIKYGLKSCFLVINENDIELVKVLDSSQRNENVGDTIANQLQCTSTEITITKDSQLLIEECGSINKDFSGEEGTVLTQSFLGKKIAICSFMCLIAVLF